MTDKFTNIYNLKQAIRKEKKLKSRFSKVRDAVELLYSIHAPSSCSLVYGKDSHVIEEANSNYEKCCARLTALEKELMMTTLFRRLVWAFKTKNN